MGTLKHLFQPGFIGKMQLKNRIVMAPLGTNLADVNGAVTRRLIEWYAERAWGGAGLIIVENTLADVRFGRGLARQLRIDDPKLTPGMSELVEAVHAAGAKIAVQINIQGAGVDTLLTPGIQPVGPSDMTYIYDEENPWLASSSRFKREKRLRALAPEEIGILESAFTQAAGFAKFAGFDAIEIHGAHGYLLASFMSPHSNKRRDEYGGDLDGRLKLVTDVYRGMRKQVGDDFPILFRFSGQEYFDGGRKIEESLEIAVRMQELGIDALDISAGISQKAEAFAWTSPHMQFPQGAFIEDARVIKKSVEIPVIGVGKIKDPDFAEKVLKDGLADFIALGRALIADPEWPVKAREGRTKEIRRCLSCNRCFVIVSHRPIRCAVNARAGMESEYPLTPAVQKQRVAVVGGGPAGMEAARVAALRGHRVTLYEKEHSLGGQLKLAVAPPFKNELRGILAYLKRQMGLLGVEVVLNRTIRPEDIKGQKFEMIIAASGSRPPGTALSQYPKARVIGAWDVLGGKVKLDGNVVVVIGSSRVALETAELIAVKKGKSVTIITPETRDKVGGDLEPIFEYRLLMERLHACSVDIITDSPVVEIDEKGVYLLGRERGFIACDHVVLAEKPVSDDSLLEGEPDGSKKIIAIGDCRDPRDIYAAIHEGFQAAYRI